MKAKFTSGFMRLIVLMAIALTATANVAEAQLPDCITGNIMYAVFNRDTVSTVADSMEIRPVNVVTGAVGSLMGGKRYWVRKRLSVGNPYYYGSSGLGVDMITNRFYVITQMSNPIPKDIITIDPIGGAMTVIGTTPSSVDQHHFVKLAISNNGFGYTLGVARDTSHAPAQYNPLLRFTTCGAVPAVGCSNIILLGYLPTTGVMNRSKLFNGDIAFDVYGNLFFVTVAFDRVGATQKYTDARLFRIDAANIPNVAGTGIIPMTFVADYNSLDTTVINGIGFDGIGDMILATRRFINTATNPSAPYTPQLYRSTLPGSSSIIAGFGPVTTGYNIADLASCYFPATILGTTNLHLQYKYENGKVNLKWEGGTTNNADIVRFEVQRSNNGTDFETIGTVMPDMGGRQTFNYTYNDPQSGFEKNKFYRIRQIMRNNYRFYSNVVNVSFNNKFNLVGNLGPNPFSNQIEAKLSLRSANAVNIRIMDQNGRIVYSRQFTGRTGENRIVMDNLNNLKPAVYVKRYVENAARWLSD